MPPRAATTERREPRPWLGRVRATLPIVLAAPIAGVALWRIATLAYIIWHRFRYPSDLEWMEGGQMVHAYRLLHGLPLYGDCSDGFVPFPYPPVHAAIVAGFGGLVGFDYANGRLVSIVAFSAACALLCSELLRASERLDRGLLFSVVALAGIASSYPQVGHWFDLVRVDSTFIALLFGGAVMSLAPDAERGERALGWRRIVAASVLLSASVFTKQTAVFFIPWIGLFAVLRHRPSGLRLCALTAAICLVALGLLQWATEGRFWMMVFEVMRNHALRQGRPWVSTQRLLILAPFLPLLPLLIGWLAYRGKLRARSVFWSGMLVCAIAASIVTTRKASAHINNLMTAAVLLWPVTLLLVSDWLDSLPRPSWRRASLACALALLGAWRLDVLRFFPRGYIPPPAAQRSARALNRWARDHAPGVTMPSHPFIPVRQHQSVVQLHRQGWVDYMESGLQGLDLVECLQGVKSEWLVLAGPHHPWFDALLATDYGPPEPTPMGIRLGGGFATPDRIYRRRVDGLATTPRANRRKLFDFETPTLDGWEQTGDAFRSGPKSGRVGDQLPIVGFRGQGFVNTFDAALRDAPTGTLRSPPFVIDRSRLGMRIGGGAWPELRVALELDGETVREARGFGREVELLGPVVWDVSELSGREARLVLVDDAPGSWGHLLADEIELFDPG